MLQVMELAVAALVKMEQQKVQDHGVL